MQQALELIQQMMEWFGDSKSEAPSNTALAALGAVRQHSARKKCVLLAWMALEEALADN